MADTSNGTSAGIAVSSATDIRHLRYFVAVAEELHFARAAERLDIAPPTLTVQIQALEDALGARLFERSKRSVALTAAGEVLLAQARHALAGFDYALEVGRRAGRGELGAVRIAYVGSAAFSGVLQRELSVFRQTAPDLVLSVVEHVMDEVPALIEDGRLDVAFVRLPMALPESLAAHSLWRDRFCVALPEASPLAKQAGAITARSLMHCDFILPEQEAGTLEVGRRGRFEPRVVIAPGGLVSVLAQVSMGVGLAIVPDVLRQSVALPGLVFKPLAGEPVVSEIGVLYRRFERAPAVLQLIAQLRQTQ